MARLPRLAVAGELHLVVQRGHNRQAVFVDDADRRIYLDMLREVLAARAVALHGYVLLPAEVWLLVTPAQAEALGRAMQSLGRRYVAYFNRRHARCGTLWDGRFRATVVDADSALLDVLVHLELKPALAGLAATPVEWPWSSAAHHLGARRDPWLVDPGQMWKLGNTPFERESAYRRHLDAGLPASRREAIDDAALRSWALGPREFVERLAARVQRPLHRRPRGRPPRPSAPERRH